MAWQEFVKGKKSKSDVQIFTHNLMDNIVSLHEDLANKTYQHGGYESFYVNDPKRRHIHKASVRDRLLHCAVYRVLYPFFDRTFIADSFSCRNDKGTHKAINRFCVLARRVGRNHFAACWVLKCDIRKFFASINHDILLKILGEYIPDKDIMWLLQSIVESFSDGLPLGNLTSQLFANVYLNVFDQWVKHKLKAKHYVRYADDFVILSSDRPSLEAVALKIAQFLTEQLKLTLHPGKIVLDTVSSGIDFLGWIHFTNHRLLRAATANRMFSRIRANPTLKTAQSYLGMLGHGNAHKLEERMLMERWLWGEESRVY